MKGTDLNSIVRKQGPRGIRFDNFRFGQGLNYEIVGSCNSSFCRCFKVVVQVFGVYVSSRD